MSKTNFSLLKAIEKRAGNQAFTSEELSIFEQGKEQQKRSSLPVYGDILIPIETRATLKPSVAGSGAEIVGTDIVGLVEPLRAALVLVAAGATFLTGLSGDVSIPVYSGSNAKWKGEGDSAEDGAGSFSKVDMSPKRLTTYIDIDKKFLAQDSIQAENMLLRDIANAVSAKLESTVFGKEAGSANQPGGLFAVEPDIKGSASWGNIIALETAVTAANALRKGAYITNSKGRGVLKTTPKVANQPGFLMDPDGKMNSYDVFITNHVVTGLQLGTDEEGIIFGEWSDFILGQWGAIDLTVDPYTRSTQAEVRITINAYFDAVMRREVSFKTGSLK